MGFLKMQKAAQPVYVFGPFQYDAQQRLLFRNGKLVPLVPKAADTLHALIEHRGRIVEKAELMRLVWPDTVVEDVGLARNISIVRKALGDEADSDRYIETIPRRGYRFIADVTVSEVMADVPQTLPRSRQHSRGIFLIALVLIWIVAAFIYWEFYRPSRYLPDGSGYANVAVIPFECLSPELDCGKFSKGFTDLTVARLSQQGLVHVISPSTVQRYQRARISPAWMGRMLGLKVLLEGSVQHVGNRVRITARLGDIHSGKIIWAETYDYPVAELDQAESESAAAIAAQVGAHLCASGTPR
jgi:DNA-binding winged helix-turn-helix (wHTH) protein/TolB-like protein